MSSPTLPDAEALVVAFLKARTAVPVATRVPAKNRPPVFIRAWRTGGAATNRIIDRPQITVQAWGPTANATDVASELGQKCRRLLFNEYTGMRLVRRVEEVSGLYYDPDPDTGHARYTFTVALTVRAGRT